MYHKCFMVLYYVQQCFTMFIEWCNDWHHCIGESVAADCLRDSNNTTGISENSAEIGDDAAGIVDIARK